MAPRPPTSFRSMKVATLTPIFRSRLFDGMVVTLLLIAIALRVIGLDHIPGINGDEAWTPVLIRDFLTGAGPWPWLTNSNRIQTPTYSGLVLIAELIALPSGWT